MESNDGSQSQNWSFSLSDQSRPTQCWRPEQPLPRQLALVPSLGLPFPTSFSAPERPPSVFITTQPVLVLEDSLVARVLGRGANHDAYSSFITRRALPLSIEEPHTSTSLVPSYNFKPQEEAVRSDNYRDGYCFQPAGRDTIVSAGVAGTDKTTTISSPDPTELTHLQPIITLMEDQSVPDATSYTPEEYVSFSGSFTPPKMSSLKESVIPESPPAPCKWSSIDFKSDHLLDNGANEEQCVLSSVEPQQSIGERVLEMWAHTIVSLASDKPAKAPNMATAVQLDVKLFNRLTLPAIEWKPKPHRVQPILPPSPPPVPVHSTLKTNSSNGASTAQISSSDYPTLKSLNLAGLGLMTSTIVTPPVHALPGNKSRNPTSLTLPTLPALVQSANSSNSEILKLTACAEREEQMLEESDCEMEMPAEVSLKTREHLGVNTDQLDIDTEGIDCQYSFHVNEASESAVTTDHTLEALPEKYPTDKAVQDLPVLTEASEKVSSSPTFPREESLEPPLKKPRLLECPDESGAACSPKPHPPQITIPDKFQTPTESADEGNATGDQALPTECARLHSLVPVHCNREEETLEHNDRSDGSGNQRLGQVQALQHNLESLDLDHQATAVVPDQTSPYATGDVLLCKISEKPLAASPDELHNTANCTFDQQIVPETTNPVNDSLESFYNDSEKVVTTLQRSAINDGKTRKVKSRDCKIRSRVEMSPEQVIPVTTPAFQPLCRRNRCTSDFPSAKGSEGVGTMRLNLTRPKLRLGLSKKQKCKSLHM